MKIHRNLAWVIGLLAAILGLSVCVDSAFADGCCCCCGGGGGGCTTPCGASCGSWASGESKACATGPTIILCSGSSTETNCTAGNQHYEVNNFPTTCIYATGTTDQRDTICNQPNANCQRSTSCTWDPTANNGNGGCSTKSGTADWTPATEPTTVACTRS